MRQRFRQRHIRQMFLLLSLMALLLGALPRWHAHDHSSDSWAAHHEHEHAQHHDWGDTPPPDEALHVHDIAAAWSGLVPSHLQSVLAQVEDTFVPSSPYASPPDVESPRLIRPPIA